MRHARRRHDVRAQDLERERVHVGQARAVGHGGKSVRANNGVELGLGAGLDGGVQRHREDERGHGRGRLWCQFGQYAVSLSLESGLGVGVVGVVKSEDGGVALCTYRVGSA